MLNQISRLCFKDGVLILQEVADVDEQKTADVMTEADCVIRAI